MIMMAKMKMAAVCVFVANTVVVCPAGMAAETPATAAVATQPIAEESAMVAVHPSMDIRMPIEVVDSATLPAVHPSIDSWMKYQEERQAYANKSPDGWSTVSHDLRSRFVPQAGVIEAGETVTMSIEVENVGTEVREFFDPKARVPAFDNVGNWRIPSMRRTGGSSADTRVGQGIMAGWRVEPKKNVIVTGSLAFVLPREGEYRVRGKVALENPLRGSSSHDDAWLILPELVLKVDAGDPAAAAIRP